jgi:hypothetical protein
MSVVHTDLGHDPNTTGLLTAADGVVEFRDKVVE